MKKKIILAIILQFTIICSIILLPSYKVSAEETGNFIDRIQITQPPTKSTFSSGEKLALTGMVVTCYYIDGTSKIITDYNITGYNSYQTGTQAIMINYQTYTTFFYITVNPSKVTNISTSNHNTTSLTLTWDTLNDVTNYEVYRLDPSTGTYTLVGSPVQNNIVFAYSSGTIHSYQIRGIKDMNGTKYAGEFSDKYTTATNPDKVTGVTTTGSTDTSITISWNQVSGATGYYVYRSPTAISSYSYIGKTNTISYIDKKLTSGKSYKYKVRAYTLNKSYPGSYSSVIKTSTNPTKVVLKYKAGDKKIRLYWTKVIGATSYDIYIKDSDSEYDLLTTNTGNSNCTYIAKGLKTGKTYTFYVIVKRDYNNAIYSSKSSSKKEITLTTIKRTNTSARYFTTKSKFKKSSAYKSFNFFRKNVIYSKNFVIPGLATTNVAGFSSTSMCPQGITFAGSYLLLTAYDLANEENSVIYVMNKSTKKLLTTIVLPTKAHVGGIAYDGTNVWVTTGTKISSIFYSKIKKAAKNGASYTTIDFNTIYSLGLTASYATFYKNKLWVGTYNELQSTSMYSYTIKKKKTTPTLIKTDKIVMPTRVQGITFTSKGYLVLSRSCQLYEGLRGYMHQLDVYKPKLSSSSNGVISLGSLVNSVDMPSMNEGVAVNGSYLYVNFESGAFSTASYKMDRICAFKISNILK